jgi:ElaB/YqjD/DUF883 family membrane-anchored ribosome-binding protein
MAEAQKRNAKGNAKVEALVRDSIEAAQARLETMEADAQRLFQEVQARVQKMSKQDWKEIRGRVAKLRKAGREAAEEWKDKAQSFRVDAVHRLEDLQVKALKVLGVASREEVEELSREINKILRRLDEVQKRRAAGARKTAQA